jgi:hypothetical protein
LLCPPVSCSFDFLAHFGVKAGQPGNRQKPT